MEIAEQIYYVGTDDREIDLFESQYAVPKGISYNSYLIMDEKITLIDTVKAPFADELLQNVSQVTPLESIDYIIINHVEPDHSGAMPALAKACPKAKFIISMAGKNEAIQHYGDIFNFQVVIKIFFYKSPRFFNFIFTVFASYHFRFCHLITFLDIKNIIYKSI